MTIKELQDFIEIKFDEIKKELFLGIHYKITCELGEPGTVETTMQILCSECNGKVD